MLLPLPQMYNEWKTWATALVKFLMAEKIDVGLKNFSVSALPSATPAGQMIFVSDEAGGAVVAFSDGSDWRRVTDRNVVS